MHVIIFFNFVCTLNFKPSVYIKSNALSISRTRSRSTCNHCFAS